MLAWPSALNEREELANSSYLSCKLRAHAQRVTVNQRSCNNLSVCEHPKFI